VVAAGGYFSPETLVTSYWLLRASSGSIADPCAANLCTASNAQALAPCDYFRSNPLPSWPSDIGDLALDTNQVIVSQNEFKKFIAPSTLSSQRKNPCHFDRREKSILDPSHSLGMTGLGPSPWRPLRSLREALSYPIFSSSRIFKYLWLDFTSPCS